MRIGAPRETAADEERVALVPETAGRLAKAGHQVVIETGAGERAGYTDEAYRQAGAAIAPGAAGVLGETDLVAKIQKPSPEEISALKPGSILVALLLARSDPDTVKALADRGVSVLAMELVPRIARAQSMDVLSSQASIAGYKAVLIAANSQGKYFPMMMTAAGTIPPAKVLVIGAGVAGLQAIATAGRLGAAVEAYDVRTAARDQVRSLGARFIEVPGAADAEAAGGYAREQTEEERRRAQEVLAEHVMASDVVITTAAIPGRPAPKIVTEEMVKGMRPGAVIVDLAAETGGNCALTEPGKVTTVNGVIIHGPLNVPSSMAHHASQLYSRNVASLLSLLTDKDGNPNLNFEDEVLDAMCVAHDGKVRLELR
ncbi:MAG: Re/Si-specific NAD(P)(+) transhydrogenase subunit alpha [Gemmatimonadetes bacterium]|nr:Re/Si-specific NAD(P)(+) transhydrogenase subunit alpha [Gemmatimonadota bacterium]